MYYYCVDINFREITSLKISLKEIFLKINEKDFNNIFYLDIFINKLKYTRFCSTYWTTLACVKPIFKA